MEVFLSSTCESFTGELNKECGYYIRQFKGRWIAQRKAKGHVPAYGHWKFICLCAKLVQVRLYFADIRVSHQERSDALSEAGLPSSGAPNENSESLSSGARHDSAEINSVNFVGITSRHSTNPKNIYLLWVKLFMQPVLTT